MTDTMLRYNTNKPQLSLLPSALISAVSFKSAFAGPMRLLNDIARVLEFGSVKYTANNWRKSGSYLRVVDSALRHIAAYQSGEAYDPESGLHHLAHVGCNIGFLLEFIKEGSGTDDRFKVEYHLVNAEPDKSEFDHFLDAFVAWKDGAPTDVLISAADLLGQYYETLEMPAPVLADDIKAASITTENIEVDGTDFAKLLDGLFALGNPHIFTIRI